MSLLYFGIGAFTALMGFLAAVNSLTSIQGGLVAGIGAIVTLAGFAEKFYIERSTEATHAQILAAASATGDRAGVAAAEQVQRHLADRTRALAKGVGLLLASISAGFFLGFGAGSVLNDHLPNHIAPPWVAGKAPQSADVALGWIAIGEKLQKDGYSKQQIRRIYDELKEKPETNVVSGEMGRAWAKK